MRCTSDLLRVDEVCADGFTVLGGVYFILVVLGLAIEARLAPSKPDCLGTTEGRRQPCALPCSLFRLWSRRHIPSHGQDYCCQAISKRSPNLNVMDYSVWAEVEKRMREQERKMPPGKREAREKFEKRLDKTAENLPKFSIYRAIGSMKRRCGFLSKAKGGLFEEGGRKRRPL